MMECSEIQNIGDSESDDLLTKLLDFIRQDQQDTMTVDARDVYISTGCNDIYPGNNLQLNIGPGTCLAVEAGDAYIPTRGNDLSDTNNPQSNTRPLSFMPNLEMSSNNIALVNEKINVSPQVEQTKVTSSLSSVNGTLISIISEPLCTADTLKLSRTKYPNHDADMTLQIKGHDDDDDDDNDDISKRVSVELEKVLKTPSVFEDIELYLECSEEDIQSIQEDNAKQNNLGAGSFSLHAGHTTLESGITLKISFPTEVDDSGGTKRCSSCKVSFSSEQELLCHLDSSKCEVLVCKDCVYNTKSVKRFLTHMERRHNISGINRLLNLNRKIQEVQKNICKTVEAKSCVADGMQNINEERVEEVFADDKSSMEEFNCTQSQIGTRMEAHLDKTAMSYPCSFCYYSGSSPKMLQMHHQNMHSRSRSIYKCEICDFTCFQKRTFDSHTKSHNEVCSFSCVTCKQKFTTHTALKRHSKTHRTERNFVCDICGKGFKIKSTLTDHTKKVHKIGIPVSSVMLKNKDHHHAAEKERLEATVLATTITRSGYENATLASEKMQQLTVDGRQTVETPRDWSLAWQLSDGNSNDYNISCREMGTNTDNPYSKRADEEAIERKRKRFSCTWPGCGKRFRDSFNLNNHYSRHVDSKNFKCSECDFECIQKGHLNYHLSTKHEKKWKIKSEVFRNASH